MNTDWFAVAMAALSMLIAAASIALTFAAERRRRELEERS